MKREELNFIALLVTDLPEPDSPTMASVSPFSRSKLMSLTALTVPLLVRKEMIRFFTSSFLAISHQLLSAKD